MIAQRLADVTPAGTEATPIAPSDRLPLIAHTLREAKVSFAELRYEGRGGIGGFIIEYQDRFRQNTLWRSVHEGISQQLTGYLWQLVLRSQPTWKDGAGSFGVMTWDLKTDVLRHTHHRRVIEICTTVIEAI